MHKRAILLRAVNVGGTAKLPMAELRDIAAELGASHIGTYIASGNLVAVVPGEPGRFDRLLEREIEQRYGFFREAISRSHSDLREALDAYPFEVVEKRFSYVVFLSVEPTAQAVESARELPTGADVWQVRGRDLYVQYANGAGKEQVSLVALLRRLGVAGTGRNLATVSKLRDLTQ
ncbi:DUF1697 domain-containing protein [Salinibacterium hongtaonis]|uniref:DUF1697 domain-containing protein n=1 Tax=Homoserinimonas hongtaonis TaxID=2079791 RepID=A0A2U1T328_9MICO|nr:DUF1697 domain-containing protein [Salinibacterium hongtaonis]AWB88485.1 DUF1697 domain-containing protein [Salinibacterium hongtaonis]PWB98267.1 DUF1697 domain-containing protein [Salinibacterium hongtaonis]